MSLLIKNLYAILAVFLSCAFLRAAEITKLGPAKGFISVTFEKVEDYDINDYVCLVREERAVACGQVVRTSDKTIQINITNQSVVLKVGQQIDINRMKSAPSGRSEVLDIVQTAPAQTYDFKNIAIGVNVSNFVVHFSQALTHTVALGLAVSYGGQSAGTGTLSGFGLSGTANYHMDGPFRTGIWGRTSVGIHLFTASSGALTSNSSSVILSAAGGYRLAFDNGLNIGAAAGLQYFLNTHFSDSFDLGFSGISPALFAEIGYTF